MINDVILWSQGKLGVPGLPGYPGRQGPKVRETHTSIIQNESLLHPGLCSHSLSPGGFIVWNITNVEMLICLFRDHSASQDSLAQTARKEQG